MTSDNLAHNDAMFVSVEYLRTKKKVLFLTTSNRWSRSMSKEIPKSTMLAQKMAEIIGTDKVTILDIPSLNITSCEGNVSSKEGNTCGVLKARLMDEEKNPSGHHRCWASINNPDDELWRVSKELFVSDAVVFFGSIRWGQTNAYYQKLIERLTWIENRHSSLQEENIVAAIDAGIIMVGQNWRATDVIDVQKQVLQFYGFNVVSALCWNWQYTKDDNDEEDISYKRAYEVFEEVFITHTAD